MKNFSIKTISIFVLLGLFWGCDLIDPDRINDPNNPPLESVEEGATKEQLQDLVTGLEFKHRDYIDNASGAITLMGAFGREIYPLFESDPRFVNQWMGVGAGADAESDPQFFLYGSAYDDPYEAIRQGNLLIEAVQNADEEVTQTERNGYLGFAKTIQAFQYLIPLNTQWDNGIRFDVSDPENLGPFLSYADALAQIRQLLDEALTDLNNAGNSFAFTLTDGFSNFSTPATFAQLNRAIAARAAVYAEDWDGALTALNAAQPFFELAQGEDVMNKGAFHSYGAPPDIFNPLFFVRNTSSTQLPVVHPDMVTDALPGDERVDNKFFQRNSPVTLQGLSSLYQDNRYISNTEPIPFIRNEELILIYAEAKIQRNQAGDLTDAENAINLIRNTWGVGNYAGATTQAALIDEMLFQRRYSLWFEGGHRWVDMRRYGRLNQLPLDGGQIYEKVARPLSETF